MASAEQNHVGPSSKRACDQCHARKVQCTGRQPCVRCAKASIGCTFLNPLRPKGPVPKRKRQVPDFRAPDTPLPAPAPAPTDGTLVLPLSLVHEAAPSPTFNETASRILAWQSRPPPTISPSPNDISPLLTLTLDGLVKPQLGVFFSRIYPMMPVYKAFEVQGRLSSPAWMNNPEWIALMFSMTALSLVHPLEGTEAAQRDMRMKQAVILMDEASRLNGRWHLGVNPSVESAMTSYCMFGALHEMGYASGARLRLREAISLGEAMGLDRAEGYAGLDPAEIKRRTRLFWILAVTERAYALQRTGQLTFDRLVTDKSTAQDVDDPEALLLKHLSSVFSSVDRKLVTCWNGKCAKSSCKELTLEQAVSTLRRLHGSVEAVFGEGETLAALNEAQKADLLITWQWMRSRVWDLASIHNLTSESGDFETSSRYVLDIASTVLGMCRRLSQPAMEHHGKGFAEKLFDITSLAARQLQVAGSVPLDAEASSTWVTTVQKLIGFVSNHPASSPEAPFTLVATLQTSIDSLRVVSLP